ncbi:MAG: hypothetical protein DMG23_10480 [Acidobacteria bacterium]|nr:MAG: hypothetical protein DMG23_10480 [Acidobacteriota bacterium]
MGREEGMQMNHCVRIPPNNYLCEEIMAKKWAAQPTNLPKDTDLSPLVAASLAGIVYQARLFNRQARMNVPEEAVISEVVNLWHTVLGKLSRKSK